MKLARKSEVVGIRHRADIDRIPISVFTVTMTMILGNADIIYIFLKRAFFKLYSKPVILLSQSSVVYG